MESARLLRFDLVLVLRLDRWGRSVADCVDTLRLLIIYGVAWLATCQGLSTGVKLTDGPVPDFGHVGLQ
jgi:DNA invertase Pin-like site-specific DNA recombinase